ncbi:MULTISPECIES: filamentous hemagglutinin N-terminal domain-containing protein [Providencia]|uniref:two-partner secretion domain-containing protein n=1 Tax=Providencia TaxID=586 RepID=UPI001BD5E6A8|nr:filamentous hemagglutinin N-terminal domain-containing protein [Providencia rettgeri]ELR5068596.1 filamentous hemagglutinin N-terminal domain-containing protein [Providencia rettgeri]ELR5221477.1 filamentous hemagglutinin N-terminal domain-containing protein [Providencia rettgeri]MDX7321407.1 filamentous hemagglutinin N-terminal domain-containing protein [Providencia rettgeri]HEC8322651.1 filamentous hemagglutinin N-terminal domain-containing protein [Providencia rettgeri]
MKNVPNSHLSFTRLKFNPLFLCVSIIVGTTTIAQAEITPTNGAGILNQGNGPTVVYINKPSQAGVSHNTYSQFDVDQKGVILNNSAKNSNTLIGGKIGGNTNVAGGRAKVILNEVNSNAATTLNGMIEVAGGKAQVIVANASGVTCNNCGFINTNRTTLTTGKVELANDGSIANYNVQQGKVAINGSLDTNSPTDLIARSVAINGIIDTQRLNVIAGNNHVNSTGKVTGTATAIGTKPIVGIDVSSIGGMYANKISLIATETGVGVSNLGDIGTYNGAISIDTAGTVNNTNGNMNAGGDIDIKAASLTNNGRIAGNKNVNITVAGMGTINNDNGDITSYNNDINLSTLGALSNNRGSIIAQQNVNTLSDSFVNDNGIVQSTKGDMNIHSMNIIYNRDNLANPNDPVKGFNAGRDITINAVRIVNENSNITAGRDSKISAQSAIDNTSNSKIIAQRHADISTMNLTQTNSEINAINGQMNLDASVSLTNGGTSTIHSGRLMNINANQLTNSGEIISNNGKSVIITNSMNNRSGYIKGNNLTIKAHNIDNQAGLINAENNLDIETSYLNNNNSNDFKLVNAKFGLTDQNGGLQTNNGTIKVKGDTLYNTNGSIAANVNNNAAARNDVDINLKAALNNNYGQITAANNQKLDVGSLENYSGKVIAGKNLTIDSKNRINNQYGVLSSTNTTKITSPIVTNGTTGSISGNRVIIDSAITN